LVKPLGDLAADRHAANDGFAGPDVIKQRREIVDMVVHAVRRFAEVGEPVAAKVVEQDGKLSGETNDDIAPDAEIGAKRIDEDDERSGARCPDHLVVQRYIVQARELHSMVLVRSEVRHCVIRAKAGMTQ
jgi:hypothetical protein